MGNALARPLGRLRGSEPQRFLMVGLDAAGKTTILYQLKLGEVVTTIPTIGFNVETVEHNGVSFTAWDVGGKDKIRPLWRHYYQNTQALIMVVDSNDKDRIGEASDELRRMLAEDELHGAALLVFANKQDLPNAMAAAEVTERLRLHTLRGCNWHIQACCATSGEGLYEGLEWVARTVKHQAKIRAEDRSCYPWRRQSSAAQATPPTSPAATASHTLVQPSASDNPIHYHHKQHHAEALAAKEAPAIVAASPRPGLLGRLGRLLGRLGRLQESMVLPVVQGTPVAVNPEPPPPVLLPTAVVVPEQSSEQLERSSFACVDLCDTDADAVRQALRAVSTHLRSARRATAERDVTRHFRGVDGGALQRSEAHWARDRSQLRLVPREHLLSHEERLTQHTHTRSNQHQQQEPEPVAVESLTRAWEILTAVASDILSGGGGGDRRRPAAALPQGVTSALDAFCYISRGEHEGGGGEADGGGQEYSCAAHTDGCACTLIVADSPGLECRDRHTEVWHPVPLCGAGGQVVAILAGRTAGGLGLGCEACEHRVRGGGGGGERTSIAIDFYSGGGHLVDPQL